jgi:hypothetical protein
MAKRYDLLKTYPDAKDLFDLSFSAVKKMYLEFQDLLAELLDDAQTPWTARRLSTHARFRHSRSIIGMRRACLPRVY